MEIVTIIPYRNTPELVENQVDQILKMSKNVDMDIVIVNCGSKPEHSIKKYEDSIYYKDDDFRGKCLGHNIGLEYLTKGYDYYWFNHPDLDFSEDMECLDKLIKTHEENEEIGVLSPTHSSPYPGMKRKTKRGWHMVTTCDYLSLMIKPLALAKAHGFLGKHFKYCYGAIHEYAYFMYKLGFCVAYDERAYVKHLGGTTYGKPHTDTISRKEYVKRAQIYAGTYLKNLYGKDWDKEFTRWLPKNIEPNTFIMAKKKWEKEIEKLN